MLLVPAVMVALFGGQYSRRIFAHGCRLRLERRASGSPDAVLKTILIPFQHP